MKLVNVLIRGLGKKNYTVDRNLSSRETFTILWEKAICLARGFYYRIFLKKCAGYLFVGKRCKIKHCHKISLGRTVIIGDNVEINALSKDGIKIGNNVSILRNSIIECTGVLRNLGAGLEIGSNVGIAQNCFIQVRGFVSIGSNVMFGPNVSIFSENHGFEKTDTAMIDQVTQRKGVVIEDDVWLGTQSVILDGVTIGKGSIVAAGAIVNINVPPYSIVAGVPARIIKSRMASSEINNL